MVNDLRAFGERFEVRALIASLLLLSACVSSARPAETPLSAQIEAYLRPYVDAREFSGSAIVLGQPDASQAQPADTDWMHYGGSLGGTRYSASAIITPGTIQRLAPAWTYRSGDGRSGEGYFGRDSSFKATPILVGRRLIFPTGFNRVIALDATSGAELWRFDPEVDFGIEYSEMFTARGVAAWRDPAAGPSVPCATRIFLGTLDARLIALDAATGERCGDFGTHGEIDLSQGIANFRRGQYSLTSPPAVVDGVVVVGSSIGDNGAVALESGAVRGFDAQTGALRWCWDPIPRDPADSDWESWENGSGRVVGAANVWGAIAGDEARGLVFLPTTSPSPDFYGGERLGDNRSANSVVAIRARDGTVVWRYQLVRHDLWDYDIAAQPMLVDIPTEDGARPALIQATKMGFVFVLDRETGEPLFSVEERAVPASDVPGERAAPTQRFPSIRLHQTDAPLPPLFAPSEDHAARCRAMLEGVRYEGIFTPPSLQGTLLYPGNPGGTNWGSMAADPARNLAFLTVNRLPTVVRLIPRAEFSRLAEASLLNGVEAQYTAQSGTPYGMARFELDHPDTDMPCLEGPWATLVALDLATGAVAWEAPAGRLPGVAQGSPMARWGSYASGGPIALAGGLVFLATPDDRALRAYDMTNGAIVWEVTLPAEPQATPMAYALEGAQYVVVMAGGNLAEGEGRGDYVIAYRLTGTDR